ncbi:hypothetical protein C8Q77DRAFT_84043 [Trametes polyzona]|nr:hypothetical protein C8Q77DRAFT_84043 [Trametes polyzona]
MEPDFIREIVKNIWRVAAANAKLIADKELTMEGAFVDPQFVLNQAAALHEAVADSVNIRQTVAGDAHQFVAMNPEFLSQQARAQQTVIDDSVRLQTAATTTHADLSSLGDAFILSLAKNLRDVVSDNANVALERKLPPNSLYMSQPDFVRRMVASYHAILRVYVENQKNGLAALEEHRLASERAIADMKTRADAAEAAKTEALSKAADAEAALAELQEDHGRLKVEAKAAADAAQDRAFKLEENLACLSSTHMGCTVRITQCEAELQAAHDELKSSVKLCEEHRVAAALAVRQVVVLTEEKQRLQCEHEKLTAELTELRAASEASSAVRAQEHDKMNEEIARLGEIVKERDALIGSLSEEKARLKSSVESARADLLAAKNQLSATVIQSDTWKATLDDVLSRQATDVEALREAAAKDKEVTEGLLGNAAKKIEELESLLRLRDQEITTLQEAAVQNALKATTPATKLPVSPPRSSKKRTLPADDKSAVTSTSHEGGWALDLAAHGSPLPLDRLNELVSLPEIAVDLGPGQVVPAIFTRQSLSNVLGGSIQGLIVRWL